MTDVNPGAGGLAYRTEVEKVVDWLAGEVGAAERGKSTTRKARKQHVKAEAVNCIIGLLPRASSPVAPAGRECRCVNDAGAVPYCDVCAGSGVAPAGSDGEVDGFMEMLRLFGPCTFNGRTITYDALAARAQPPAGVETIRGEIADMAVAIKALEEVANTACGVEAHKALSAVICIERIAAEALRKLGEKAWPVTAASEQAVAGEWITWSGGENPVPGAKVNLRQIAYANADNDVWESDAQDWKRSRQGEAGDILAYRVVTAADESSVGTDGGEAAGSEYQ